MAETAEILYARSLLETAQEAGCLNEARAEMTEAEQLFSENPAYLRLLSSPVISKQEKFDSLSAVFDGRMTPDLVNFLKVLVQNGRIALFSEICAAFHEMADRTDGILEAEAVTAVPLTPPLREQLCQRLEQTTGRKIRLSERVDPSVLGGVLLRYGGKEIDGTVRQRLTALKRQLDSASV